MGCTSSQPAHAVATQPAPLPTPAPVEAKASPAASHSTSAAIATIAVLDPVCCKAADADVRFEESARASPSRRVPMQPEFTPQPVRPPPAPAAPADAPPKPAAVPERWEAADSDDDSPAVAEPPAGSPDRDEFSDDPWTRLERRYGAAAKSPIAAPRTASRRSTQSSGRAHFSSLAAPCEDVLVLDEDGDCKTYAAPPAPARGAARGSSREPQAVPTPVVAQWGTGALAHAGELMAGTLEETPSKTEIFDCLREEHGESEGDDLGVTVHVADDDLTIADFEDDALDEINAVVRSDLTARLAEFEAAQDDLEDDFHF